MADDRPTISFHQIYLYHTYLGEILGNPDVTNFTRKFPRISPK